MKREELKQLLKNAGIPDSLYDFDGTGKGRDGIVSMMRFGDSWRIYLMENGIKIVDEYFNTEDEACDFFFKQLIN